MFKLLQKITRFMPDSGLVRTAVYTVIFAVGAILYVAEVPLTVMIAYASGAVVYSIVDITKPRRRRRRLGDVETAKLLSDDEAVKLKLLQEQIPKAKQALSIVEETVAKQERELGITSQYTLLTNRNNTSSYTGILPNLTEESSCGEHELQQVITHCQDELILLNERNYVLGQRQQAVSKHLTEREKQAKSVDHITPSSPSQPPSLTPYK